MNLLNDPLFLLKKKKQTEYWDTDSVRASYITHYVNNKVAYCISLSKEK